MASNYPAGLDELTDGVGQSTDPLQTGHVGHHTAVGEAVEAVQAELGLDPAGAAATVRARLDTLDTTVAGKADTHTHPYLPLAGGALTGPVTSTMTGVADPVKTSLIIPDGTTPNQVSGVHSLVNYRTATPSPGTGVAVQAVKAQLNYGSATGVAANKNAHALTVEAVVQRNGNVDNEVAGQFIALRDDTPAGEAHPRLWLVDASVHGAIGEQQKLLLGQVTFINNHYNGSPTIADSAALTIVSQQGDGGGVDAAHQAAPTYPVDAGIIVTGNSGTAPTGSTYGFTTGIRVGGNRAAWFEGATARIGTGIRVSDYALFGVHVTGRTAGATGPAIAVADGAGPVLAGSTTAVHSTTNLEVIKGTDANADPLVFIGASGFTRAYTVNLRNATGQGKWFVASSANQFVTGTVSGDTGYAVTTAGRTYHLGGTLSVVAVTNGNALGFHNSPPIAKPTVSGSRAGNAALDSLLTALANYGLITNSTSA